MKSQSLRHRFSLVPLLAAAVFAFGAGACSNHTRAETPPSPPPGEVWLTQQQFSEGGFSAAQVADREVGTRVMTTGKVAFDDQHVSHVFSPVTGRVVKIDASLGQRIKKGDALASIDSPDIGVASAELDKARADMVAAEHDYKRQKELFEAHAGAQKDYETAEDNFLKAKAEMQRAQQKAKLLRAGSTDAVTQNYVLRSLIDGELLARNISPGMEVQGQYTGGNSVELFTIGELDPLWVLADIFEMDLGKVHPGQKVHVSVVSYPNENFEGTVDWVSGTLDPSTRTAKARCVIPNPDHRLKPEMYATVAIDVEGKKALAVPKNAVLRLGDQTVVFVELPSKPDGMRRFERRPVTVSEEDEGGEYVPVLKGLEPGEMVVTGGAILLSGML